MYVVVISYPIKLIRFLDVCTHVALYVHAHMHAHIHMYACSHICIYIFKIYISTHVWFKVSFVSCAFAALSTDLCRHVVGVVKRVVSGYSWL